MVGLPTITIKTPYTISGSYGYGIEGFATLRLIVQCSPKRCDVSMSLKHLCLKCHCFSINIGTEENVQPSALHYIKRRNSKQKKTPSWQFPVTKQWDGEFIT